MRLGGSERREARRDLEMGVCGLKRRSREDPGKIHRSRGFSGVHGLKGRSRGDPGKIHRSRGFGVQECWEREEWRGKDSKVSQG